jgi:hypothetical protein
MIIESPSNLYIAGIYSENQTCFAAREAGSGKYFQKGDTAGCQLGAIGSGTQ